MGKGYYVAMRKQEFYRKKWLELLPNLKDSSGIYVLTRNDESGLRFCYVGQAVKVLQRLCSHCLGYQHIDLSIKKRKLYNENTNPYGWNISEIIYCDKADLDTLEQQTILGYSNNGFQLLNKTSGSQGSEKATIDDSNSTKGYHDGLRQGYKNCLKDIKEYFDKYLVYTLKGDCRKKDGTVKEIYLKKVKEFGDLLNGSKQD